MTPLLRLAGGAALAAAAVHLLQFLVLGIGPALSNEPEFPTPAESAANYWFGLAGMATFALITLGYLVFFSAATQLTRGEHPNDPAWRGAMQLAAGIGITGFLFAGTTNLAIRGFNATAVQQAAGDDPVISRAVLQGSSIVISIAMIAATVAFAIWFVAFAVRGIRSGVIGWPVAVAVVLFGGLLPLAGWLTNTGAIPAIIIAFFVLGPALLTRARRLRRAEVAAPPVKVTQ